jgi:hypothetical protein
MLYVLKDSSSSKTKVCVLCLCGVHFIGRPEMENEIETKTETEILRHGMLVGCGMRKSGDESMGVVPFWRAGGVQGCLSPRPEVGVRRHLRSYCT